MREILGVKLYSIPEVARLLDVTYYTCRKYLSGGKLPYQAIGGRHYVTEENLKAFLRGMSRDDGQ